MAGWAAHPVAWGGDWVVSFSRVRPRGVPDREKGSDRCHASGAAVDVSVTLPPGRGGLNVWRMAVLSTFRAPSLCRHVHRELLRSVLLDLTPIIAATACHQRNDVERYSRYMGDQFIIERAGKPMAAVVPIWQHEAWQKQHSRPKKSADTIKKSNRQSTKGRS